MDLGLNPKGLRLDEQISLEYTNSFIEEKKSIEKKSFHFLDNEIINAYEESKNDPELQAQIVKESNEYEEKDNNVIHKKSYDRDER